MKWSACLLLLVACSKTQEPKPTEGNRTSPDVFRVKFETTQGDFTVQVTQKWAPRGAERFYTLVRSGLYDGCRFFRIVNNFVAQFGINGDPKVSAAWRTSKIKDDPVTQRNLRGAITFATSGPNSRTTQLFINLKSNDGLDGQGFAPFGMVVEGMEVVDKLYAGYDEQMGRAPNQSRIESEGNAYLDRDFPKLDSIKTARVLE
jgi:peptidyl-prolyl cis-trans isomerase A (cyclophilin A)